jgi:hypothetical protein
MRRLRRPWPTVVLAPNVVMQSSVQAELLLTGVSPLKVSSLCQCGGSSTVLPQGFFLDTSCCFALFEPCDVSDCLIYFSAVVA